MNDSASDARLPEISPPQGEGLPVRADGSSAAARRVGKPLADSPTIITSSPPIPSPAVGDSSSRILEGRVMPGDRIGHFDLVEYVGGGGMGRVFRAIDTKLGRTVALKLLPPEQAAGADALQRFQNEAQSAARLDHENIARVYFVGEERDLPFIVFEFVEGMNVRLLVERKGPLPLAEAISYTIQVTEALAHADSRGVVHRDIKPSNVLITPEGRVKLIDMGLARLRGGDAAGEDLTQSGVTLGTFDYISPEQARDPRNADIRSDIYSLGCTLFFMLAGQPPFPEGTVLQKLLQHQGDEPPDVRRLRPDLPEELSRVMRKMMAKDPRRRYATSAELAGDLLALADQIGLRPMSPTSRVWLTPPDRSVSFFQRHLPWMAPVAALFCVVLLVDRVSAPRDDQSPPPLIDVAPKDAGTKSVAVKDVVPRDDIVPKDVAQKRGTPDASPERSSQPLSPILIENGESPTDFLQDPLGELKMSPFNAAPPGTMARIPDRDAGDLKPSVVTPQKRSRTLIVGDNAHGPNEFSSLVAACAVAQNEDVIELRFNGPRRERPMKLSNLQVTVRAAEGYQPVIRFRPTEINPINPRSMFTLSAGRLTMVDVAVELYVPREVLADNWAMIETWGGQTVRLERCSLTVCNASDRLTTYHQEVAFVRARPAPDADVAVGNSTAATPLATVELADCVARGEAVFLSVEDLQPVYLLWDNGLLATSEQLLTAGGGQVAPKPDEVLRLELRHLTAAVRGGLCRLSATSANPYQLTVQFVCTDDIILTAPGAPLVEQEGTASVEKSRQRFVWNGDRNFYQDVDVFWMVRNMDSQVAPDVMAFEGWKTHWGRSRENQPSREPLAWRRSPNADRPPHAHTAADYTLEDPTFNDASNGAPGFRGHRLPALPTELFQERSGPAASSVRGDTLEQQRNDG
jgi:serine/threonine-protein kinase